MRRHATTLVLFAAVVGALAALAALLLPAAAGATQPTQRPAPVTVAPAVHAAPDAFLTALLGDATDLAPGQGEQLLEAADRVCEGITAQVPEGFMIRTVSEEQGVTLEEAHQFVETAMSVHCVA